VIKVAIRLAIVAFLANATWRLGTAYAKHYRFTDAVRQTTQFRGDKTDDQVHDRVFELAASHDIPVSDENLTVTRQENHTIVEGAYREAIDLFPGFTYKWPFTVHIDTFIDAHRTP
jgi:hypothetical protein